MKKSDFSVTPLQKSFKNYKFTIVCTEFSIFVAPLDWESNLFNRLWPKIRQMLRQGVSLVSKPNQHFEGRVFFCFECVLYHGRYEKAQFRFSDEAWALIEPHLPSNQPVARRVEDRRVILGIVHVLKVGFGWCDCPAEQGPSSTRLQSVQSLVAARVSGSSCWMG